MSIEMTPYKYETATSRNLGFWSQEEQDMLRDSTVSIAGAGGDGGELAITLARMGVGTIRLADPDPFETENLNRQAACNIDTIGVNKAVAVGNEVENIGGTKVELFTDGLTRTNAAEFVDGSQLVIDETEFTIHSLGVQLAREARKAGVPNLMAMNIGFGATVTSFHPTKGKTFESILGLSDTASLDDIDAQEVAIDRWLPYIPSYGDMPVLEKVASGEKSAPSVAPGVAIAAGIASTQALLHLVSGAQNRRPTPVFAPDVLVMDAMTGVGKIVKQNRFTHTRHAAVMALRSKLGLNPVTSY